MDARKNMIIAKDEIITSRVKSCIYNKLTAKWDVEFSNGKMYSYNRRSLKWLKSPKGLNPKHYHIFRNGKMLDNIDSLFYFSDNNFGGYHICFSNGSEKDYNENDLDVEESCLADSSSDQVFSYLQEVAENVSVETEEGIAILSKQYEKIDFLSKENAAAAYFNPKSYKSNTDCTNDTLIFPFGCNKSQYNAVKLALLNHISIIEGPPGTGKTQTILNIIANLLIQGKTVQVVSNNNSAIENIIEKLSKSDYEMDFFVASLGKTEKKEHFIESQTGRYPNFSKWEKFSRSIDKATIRTHGEELQTVFNNKNRLAKLIEERDIIESEQKHFISVMSNIKQDGRILPKECESDMVLRICQELEAHLRGERALGFFRKLRFRFLYGFSFKFFGNKEKDSLIPQLQLYYYQKKLSEINNEIDNLNNELNNTDAENSIKLYTKESLDYFKEFLIQRYGKKESRKVFEKNDLWQNPDSFLLEYPVVLSTTYTARSSLGKNAQFDYVIMDEASQVDIATGVLALSCARNAVIVGDSKQLPNIVTNQQKDLLESIGNKYRISDDYNCLKNTFLDSCCKLLGTKIPKTVLNEHYRCDPQIIGYCNQKFYNNALVVMTDNHLNPLKLVTTVAGNHVREQSNLRQVEVIINEILPELTCKHSDIGIIAPYRNQIKLLRSKIPDLEIEIDTIHKFQGREKKVIIFSTTDDMIKDFSDDANLLNVAVSRAEEQLIIVASEMDQPIGSNVGDLIGYIQYHNYSVKHSSISSVFDYLYVQNEGKRLEFLKKHRRISEYDSENLLFGLIENELKRRRERLGVICHQPLYLLFSDFNKMNNEERRFVKTGLSHLDFLIYNLITKQPILAIEVDGYNYHKADTEQDVRDKLKNHILESYHIPLIRFKTNGSNEELILHKTLNEICKRN